MVCKAASPFYLQEEAALRAQVAQATPSDSPWMAVTDDSGKTYYWNQDTDETSWDKPAGFVEPNGDSGLSAAEEKERMDKIIKIQSISRGRKARKEMNEKKNQKREEDQRRQEQERKKKEQEEQARLEKERAEEAALDKKKAEVTSVFFIAFNSVSIVWRI